MEPDTADRIAAQCYDMGSDAIAARLRPMVERAEYHNDGDVLAHALREPGADDPNCRCKKTSTVYSFCPIHGEPQTEPSEKSVFEDPPGQYRCGVCGGKITLEKPVDPQAEPSREMTRDEEAQHLRELRRREPQAEPSNE